MRRGELKLSENQLEETIKKRGVDGLPPFTTLTPLLDYWKGAADAPKPDDSRDAFTLIFETGCRRAEAVQIQGDQFTYNDGAILIRNVPVLKKPNPRDRFRDVLIKRDKLDPLADELVKLVERRGDGYLLPGYAPFGQGRELDRPMSEKSVYNRIVELSPDLFPHALRSYRASFLVWVRHFELRDLVDWFKWESRGGIQMALHYTAQVDMARKLGIDEVPL